MAEEKQSGGGAKEEAPEYPTERIIREASDFLGVPTHVAAGALVDANKNITLDEAKKAVKDFEKRPVEADNPILWGKQLEESQAGGES